MDKRSGMFGGINMTKKVAVLFLVLTIVLSGAFAKNTIQIGPSVTWNRPASEFDGVDFTQEFTNVNNFTFGADVRLNLGYFQLATQAGIGGLMGGDAKALTFNTNATANLKFDISILELFFGAGANMDIARWKDNGTWTVNNGTFDDFADALSRSNLIYRAGLGLNLGFLGLNLQAIVPTKGTFQDEVKDIFTPVFESTKVTASVLFNFF